MLEVKASEASSEKIKMAETLEYLIKILPSGNSKEFPLIDRQLEKRGINFESRDLQNGGRIYRIPKSEEGKLPSDEKGHYLPVDEKSGHSLYPDKNNKLWEKYKR